MDIIVFYIPTSSEKEALQLGRDAMAENLAACSNVFPVASAYTWQGSLREDSEYILILKTTVSKRSALKAWLESAHPYEVPCIASWLVDVNTAYGKWVEEQVQE